MIPSHTGCLTAGGDSGKVRSEVGVIQQHPIGHPIGQSDEDRNPATNVELHSVTDEESLIPATVRKEKKQPLHDESHGSVWGSESKKGNTTAQREGRQRREEQHQENANSSFSRRDVRAGLMAMFDGLDADCDGVLCREEVRDIGLHANLFCSGCDINSAACATDVIQPHDVRKTKNGVHSASDLLVDTRECWDQAVVRPPGQC